LGQLLPKGEEEIGVVQLAGVVLRRPPAMLRRGGGASMVGEKVELLHGLGLREKVRGVKEGERRLGGDSQVLEGRADEWGHEGVRGAKSLCA